MMTCKKCGAEAVQIEYLPGNWCHADDTVSFKDGKLTQNWDHDVVLDFMEAKVIEPRTPGPVLPALSSEVPSADRGLSASDAAQVLPLSQTTDDGIEQDQRRQSLLPSDSRLPATPDESRQESTAKAGPQAPGTASPFFR